MARFRLPALIFFSLLLAGFFITLYFLPGLVISRLDEKCRKRYRVSLSAGSARFSGLRQVTVDSLTAVMPRHDTLFFARQLRIDCSILGFLTGRNLIERFYADSVVANLDAFRRLNPAMPANSRKKANRAVAYTNHHGKRINRLVGKIFSAMPRFIGINRLEAVDSRHSRSPRYVLHDFMLKSGKYDGLVTIVSTTDTVSLLIAGSIHKKQKSFSLTALPDTPGTSSLTYYADSSPLRLSFDTAWIRVGQRAFENGVYRAGVQLGVANPSVSHWRLGTLPIALNTVSFTGSFFANESEIGIDSTSSFLADSLHGTLGLRGRLRTPGAICLQTDIPWTDAQKFINSLPRGMFTAIAGTRARGRLAYRLRFEYDSESPDSLVFLSRLDKEGFRIVQFGNSNLAMLNEPFMHTVYERGRPVRTFLVGPGNPSFTPLGQISTYLQAAVLTAEDGAFYSHGGFNENAFRESVLENIRQKRFARGGSTITMQLVKNVFLSAQKTVARKAEEAFITWMIEKNKLVSKDRMLEVYLNIIEWGPGIYGATEASKFYFEKDPASLTLAESIFMASLVPHPRYFRYSVDSLGRLRPFLVPFFGVVAGHMLKKNHISQEEFDRLAPDITLTGPALQAVLKKSIVLPDSIATEITDDLALPVE